jgi:hypothetical protein
MIHWRVRLTYAAVVAALTAVAAVGGFADRICGLFI